MLYPLALKGRDALFDGRGAIVRRQWGVVGAADGLEVDHGMVADLAWNISQLVY